MMVASGAIMAFQAPINAALRGHVGTWESSLLSFIVGALVLAAVVLVAGKGDLGRIRALSAWHLVGGLIGAIFVTTSLVSAPVIGVTWMMVAGLAGQMVGALAIDALGLVGMTKRPVDLPRAAGLALLVVSMILINWNAWKKSG